jgi:hypothetical protein
MESGTKNDAPPAKNGGGPAFHSRLEPHVEFIRELRQQRRTWKEIASLLGTEKGCPGHAYKGSISSTGDT